MFIRLLKILGVTGVLFAHLALAAPVYVNVNTADAQLLADVLDGVGMSRARAIIE